MIWILQGPEQGPLKYTDTLFLNICLDPIMGAIFYTLVIHLELGSLHSACRVQPVGSGPLCFAFGEVKPRGPLAGPSLRRPLVWPSGPPLALWALGRKADSLRPNEGHKEACPFPRRGASDPAGPSGAKRRKEPIRPRGTKGRPICPPLSWGPILK